MKKYYKLTFRRGHVGTGNKQYITFYSEGRNMLDAIDHIKTKGGIHHDRLPINCIEISADEYQNQKRLKYNAYQACGAK